MEKYLIVILFLLLSHNSYSQTFNGRLLGNDDKKPVEYASVSLLRADSLTIDYSMTDEKGFFSISTQNDQLHYIHFSCMGYTPMLLDLKKFKNGSEFFLDQSAISLREVKVKAEPIKQHGDTLVYAVGSFRMAQDRSIGDVIKRLPGIDVAKNGAISYQGVPIQEFNVEGMNLTGGKYNLISNNLSAKAVKDVQILENHQPIASLRGVRFSDKATLNLVLEDDAKNKIFGAIDLGAGYEQGVDNVIWDNRLLMMLFAPNMQNMSMYKSNNMGVDITEELRELTTSVARRLGAPQESGILSPISISIGDIDRRRFFFNNAHLLTTNHLVNYKKDETLRFQASYYHNEETQRRESVTTYFLPDGNISIFEDINALDKRDELEGTVNYKMNKENNYIDNSLKVLSRFNTNNGSIIGNEDILQKTSLDRLSLTNEFDLIHKVDNKTLRLTSVNVYNNLPQYIEITPGLYPELLNDSIDYDMMRQNARTKSFFTHTYTSFTHPLLVFSTEYKAGFKLKTQGLTSSVNTTGEYFPISLSDSLSNDFRYTETDFYITPSLTYRNMKFKSVLELNASLISFYRHDYLHDKLNKTDYKLIWEPALTLEYNINALYKISTSFRYNQDYSDIYSLYPGYIFRSYRYASNNDVQMSFRKSFNSTIMFNYKNPITGLFYTLSGYYTSLKQNTLSKTEFDGILQKTSNIRMDAPTDSWGGSGYIGKSLSFWRSQISGRYSYSNNESLQLLSDVMTQYRNESHYISLSFTTRPLQKLNFEAESTFYSSRMRQTVPDKRYYEPMSRYIFRLTANYLPSDRLQFKFINEYYYNTSKENPSKYLSDLQGSYIFKNKSELQLMAYNIFDNNDYRIDNYGDVSESSRLYRLHGRQIMIKYLFNF